MIYVVIDEGYKVHGAFTNKKIAERLANVLIATMEETTLDPELKLPPENKKPYYVHLGEEINVEKTYITELPKSFEPELEKCPIHKACTLIMCWAENKREAIKVAEGRAKC